MKIATRPTWRTLALLCLACLCLTLPAFSTVQVTASLVDAGSNFPRTSFLQMELQNCGDYFPNVPGQPATIVQEKIILRPNPTTGVISGQVLGNDQIQCGGVYSTLWHVTLMKDSNTPAAGARDYYISALTNPWNPATAMPTTGLPPVPGFQTIFANPTGSQTITEPANASLNLVGTIDFTNATVVGLSAGGTTVQVNGATVSTPNFNSSAPSLGNGYVTCTFLSSGSNVTLGCPLGIDPSTAAPGSGSTIYAPKINPDFTGGTHVAVPTPTNTNDAVTKAYADALIPSGSNASQIQGTTVDNTAPTDLQVLAYQAGLAKYKATTAGLVPYLNEGSTGTVVNELVKIDATTGKAIVTAGGELQGVIGIVDSGAGTTGTAYVQATGKHLCVFDAASATAGHMVGISATSGLCSDVGTSPTTGAPVGEVVAFNNGSLPSSCNTGTGCMVSINLGSATPNNVAGNQIINNPSTTQTIQPSASTVAALTLKCPAGSAGTLVCFEADDDAGNPLLRLQKNGTATFANGNGTISANRAAFTLKSVAFSATPTFDASQGSTFKFTMTGVAPTGNVTSSTLSNIAAGNLSQPLIFELCEDSNGGHTFVWPTNVKNAPVVSIPSSTCSQYVFWTDGTNAYASSGTTTGTSFPLLSNIDGANLAPAYSWRNYPEEGWYATSSPVQIAVTAATRSGCPGACSVTVTLASFGPAGSSNYYSVGQSVNFNGLADGTFNGTYQLIAVSSGGPTVTFLQTGQSTNPTIGAGGNAQLIIIAQSGHTIQINRLQSSTTNPSQTGTLQLAHADPIKARYCPTTSGACPSDGSDVTLLKGWGSPPAQVVTSTGDARRVQLGDAWGAQAPGTIEAPNFVSNIATGTAPLTVASTTVVPNLNVALLNGATFAAPGTIGNTTPNTGTFTTAGMNTLNLNGATSGTIVCVPDATAIKLTCTLSGSPAGVFQMQNSSPNWLMSQVANGSIVIQSRRATDSSPTGGFLKFFDFAGSHALFQVSITGAWSQGNTSGTTTIGTNNVGQFNNYGSLPTAGMGVAPIYGVFSQTGLGANQTQTLYTTAASGAGSSGTYRVCATAWTVNAGTGTTMTMNVVYNNGTATITHAVSPTLSLSSTATPISECVTLHSAVSQAIQVTTSGTYGTSTFGLEATVEMLQ